MTYYQTPEDIEPDDQAMVDSMVAIGALQKIESSQRWYNPDAAPICEVHENEYEMRYVEEKEMDDDTATGYYHMVYV